MTFKPYCEPCRTWHTEQEGHVMTAKFQAGVGPSMKTLHIYEIPPEGERAKLSLCKSTNVARNYRGVVSIGADKLCDRCMRALQKQLPEGAAITAELIGVASIEE